MLFQQLNHGFIGFPTQINRVVQIAQYIFRFVGKLDQILLHHLDLVRFPLCICRHSNYKEFIDDFRYRFVFTQFAFGVEHMHIVCRDARGEFEQLLNRIGGHSGENAFGKLHSNIDRYFRAIRLEIFQDWRDFLAGFIDTAVGEPLQECNIWHCP